MSFEPKSFESKSFEPKIVAFLCNWCSYRGADLAGTSRMKSAPNVRPIRVMCSGRVEPDFILKAFEAGADGVLVLGCHPGDCHYSEGNYKTVRRIALLKKLLSQFTFINAAHNQTFNYPTQDTHGQSGKEKCCPE